MLADDLDELLVGPAIPAPRMRRQRDIAVFVAPDELEDIAIVRIELQLSVLQLLCVRRDLLQVAPVDDVNAIPFAGFVEPLSRPFRIIDAGHAKIISARARRFRDGQDAPLIMNQIERVLIRRTGADIQSRIDVFSDCPPGVRIEIDQLPIGIDHAVSAPGAMQGQVTAKIRTEYGFSIAENASSATNDSV